MGLPESQGADNENDTGVPVAQRVMLEHVLVNPGREVAAGPLCLQ